MIAITADTPELAKRLQQQTGLPMQCDAPDADYHLHAGQSRLELRSCRDPATTPLFVDFVEGASRHRRLYGGGKGQAIARAVGLKKLGKPDVADLTAGLGRDAFVLASLGCRVIMVERSPVVHALLRDGLKRALACDDASVSEIASRMSLVHADGLDWLAGQGDAIDVVYLDPMFPERRKSAKVKKAMRFFHDIVGDDRDADSLLEPARLASRRRVVVKRPAKAPYLCDRQPAWSVDGKSTRFDLYIAASQHKKSPSLAD